MKRCILILLFVAFSSLCWGGRSFNGSSDKITVYIGTGAAYVVGSNTVTVECDFMVTSVPGAEADICANGGQFGSNSGPWIISIGSTYYAETGQIQANFYQNQPLDHGIQLKCSSTVTTNVIHHVFIVFVGDGNPGAWLYDNGTLCADTSTANTLGVSANGSYICIGGYWNGSTGCTANFAGTVYGLTVWTQGLGVSGSSPYSFNATYASQLNTTCVNVGAMRHAPFPKPVFQMPLAGAASPEPDLSGNVQNGTLTGTTAANGPPCTP